MNMRRIARTLGLHRRTASLWIMASAAKSPAAPVPKEVKTAEMDELFTITSEKISFLLRCRLLSNLLRVCLSFPSVAADCINKLIHTAWFESESLIPPVL